MNPCTVPNPAPAQRTTVLSTGPTVTITALPQRVNLVTYAGDDLNLTLHVRDQDGKPADISHMEISAQVRQVPCGPVAAEFTTAHDPERTGVAHLRLRPDATAALPGRAVWDVQAAWGHDGTGPGPDHVITLAAGHVTVSPDVTRHDDNGGTP